MDQRDDYDDPDLVPNWRTIPSLPAIIVLLAAVAVVFGAYSFRLRH